MGKTQPGQAVTLTLALLSLAGVPPLVGFMGKMAVFGPLVGAGYAWLAVAGVLASVVAAYYSLNLIKMMWFVEPTAETRALRVNGALGLHVGLMALVLVLLGVFPTVIQATLMTAVAVIY